MSGCLPRNSVPSYSTAVWITDAVLAESLRRFTCTHRRHGSNVPGPLEARRRAAKRRNTNLAYNGGAQHVDPAILFPTGSRDAWWQQEARPLDHKVSEAAPGRGGSLASRALPFLLPPWLLPQPEAPRSMEDDSPVLDSLKAKHQSPAKVREPPTSLNQGLKLCHTVEDVKDLLSRHSIQLQQVPDVSIAIFGHVLGSRWTAENVAAFISEPDLNPPGTTNHVRLVRRIVDPLRDCPYRTTAHWETLRMGIGKAARLGLVAPESMREIIRIIPKVRTHSSGTGQLRHVGRAIKDISALVANFVDSGIYQLNDLGQEYLKTLYQDAVKMGPSAEGTKLLLRLQDPSKTETVAAFAQVIEQWLSSPAPKQSDTRLGDAMLALPTQTLLPVISSVTEILMSRGTITPPGSGLGQWQQVLRALHNDQESGHYNEDLLDPRLLQTGFTGLLTVQQQLLALTWIIHNLNYHRGFSKSQVNSLQLDETFEKVFRQIPDQPTGDILATVVSTLQTINVPDQTMFLRHLSLLTKYNLVLYSGTRNPEQAVDGLLERELHQLADDTFYNNAKLNFNDALVEACQSTNEHIASLASAAYEIIRKDKLDFKLVTRALKHNRDLHLALSQSRRTGNAAGETNMQDQPAQNISSTCQLTPRTALSIVNTIALAFSKSNAISPRSALQKVYWCYIFLHRYGAPIEASISRALWHAGVIRFGTDRVSKTQLLWILRVVREVEGPDTARALLFNAGFRKHRVEMMESVAAQSGIDGLDHREVCEDSSMASIFHRKDDRKFVDLG